MRRQGPLPEWLALRWADELLDGLAYLHSQQPPIIHRDIKPGNLKLRQDDTLVLVDFGIAKEYLPGVDTIPGADAVTPGFSPLEQYSDALTDARSDLYSVGATMYFLLTGVAPPPRRTGPRATRSCCLPRSSSPASPPAASWRCARRSAWRATSAGPARPRCARPSTRQPNGLRRSPCQRQAHKPGKSWQPNPARLPGGQAWRRCCLGCWLPQPAWLPLCSFSLRHLTARSRERLRRRPWL